MARVNRKVEFRLDEAKMLNIGGGSISSFCEQYNIDRMLMYSIKNKSHVKTHTKSADIVAKLIKLGVGRYVNTDKDDNFDASDID